MEALRLFKVEALVADDHLDAEEVTKRLGSFVIQLSVDELDASTLLRKPTVKKAQAKKAVQEKPEIKKRRIRKRGFSSQVQERLELIQKTLGKKSMTVREIQAATGIAFDSVCHVLEAGEKKRIFSVVMKPNGRTRPVRYYSNNK